MVTARDHGVTLWRPGVKYVLAAQLHILCPGLICKYCAEMQTLLTNNLVVPHTYWIDAKSAWRFHTS